jgi:hypothetical protein
MGRWRLSLIRGPLAGAPSHNLAPAALQALAYEMRRPRPRSPHGETGGRSRGAIEPERLTIKCGFSINRRSDTEMNPVMPTVTVRRAGNEARLFKVLIWFVICELLGEPDIVNWTDKTTRTIIITLIAMGSLAALELTDRHGWRSRSSPIPLSRRVLLLVDLVFAAAIPALSERVARLVGGKGTSWRIGCMILLVVWVAEGRVLKSLLLRPDRLSSKAPTKPDMAPFRDVWV